MYRQHQHHRPHHAVPFSCDALPTLYSNSAIKQDKIPKPKVPRITLLTLLLTRSTNFQNYKSTNLSRTRIFLLPIPSGPSSPLHPQSHRVTYFRLSRSTLVDLGLGTGRLVNLRILRGMIWEGLGVISGEGIGGYGKGMGIWECDFGWHGRLGIGDGG